MAELYCFQSKPLEMMSCRITPSPANQKQSSELTGWARSPAEEEKQNGYRVVSISPFWYWKMGKSAEFVSIRSRHFWSRKFQITTKLLEKLDGLQPFKRIMMIMLVQVWDDSGSLRKIISDITAKQLTTSANFDGHPYTMVK